MKKWFTCCLVLVCLIALPPAPAFAATAHGENPVVIILWQLNRLEDSSTEATRYLKQLVEQRSNQRLRVTVQLSNANNGTAKAQMLVTDSRQAARLNGKSNPDMQLIGKLTDSNYRIMVDMKFMERLSAELNIILKGAVKDTLRYLADLERIN